LRPERLALLALAGGVAASGVAAAAGIDGLSLGASERAVTQRLPNAHCQPLQWDSRAADRRCDDSRAMLGGLEVRITVYLKADAVEAFDVRFDSREAARVEKLATEHFGAKPLSKDQEKARTLHWLGGGERGLLSTQPGQRRASLLVWRGAFYDEIYRVR
jgi:hypothetical protein